MRLTRAGMALIVVATASFVVGRIFGALELFLLGSMMVVVLLIAVLSTSTSRLDLAIGRTAAPVRLRAGAPARIDLTLRNNGRRSPALLLRDEVQETKAATLMLAPIPSGETARVAYRLPTRRRGILRVGPLDLTIGDPLGLTRSVVRASRDVSLTVHAALVDLETLHASAGRDPTADQQAIRTLAVSGDEFYALRPYEIGDELRRVHWPATARTGELVVRQEERSRTGRVTVVLDRNRVLYDEEGFERAVSAALSALHAGWKGDDALRFVAAGTGRYADIRSRLELDAIDEQLATLSWSDHASLITTIDEVSRMGKGGTLVIVTGLATADLKPCVERARRSFGRIHVVVCHQATEHLPAEAIVHDGQNDLPNAWRQQISRQSRRS